MLFKASRSRKKECEPNHGDVFGKPAIVTDTHCIRLVNRIGLVDNIKEPKKWRWLSGKSYRQRKAAISATDWYTMEETSVQPEQSLTAKNAVFVIFAGKTGCKKYTPSNLQEQMELLPDRVEKMNL